MVPVAAERVVRARKGSLMKLQIEENSSRAARPSICFLSVLLFLVAACSGGRSALSTEPVSGSSKAASTSDTSDTSDLPACGSMTKPCDPKNLGGQTCSMMGMGSGTLMCDPVTCSFDTSNCTLSGNTGGGGLGALLGAFGRNQGGRAAMMGQATSGRGGRAASGRGGMQGQREDDQEAESAGRGGEASDNEDDDADEEAGRGGEGGSSGETPDAGSSNASDGGQGGQPGDAGDTPAQ